MKRENDLLIDTEEKNNTFEVEREHIYEDEKRKSCI